MVPGQKAFSTEHNAENVGCGVLQCLHSDGIALFVCAIPQGLKRLRLRTLPNMPCGYKGKVHCT